LADLAAVAESRKSRLDRSVHARAQGLGWVRFVKRFRLKIRKRKRSWFDANGWVPSRLAICCRSNARAIRQRVLGQCRFRRSNLATVGGTWRRSFALYRLKRDRKTSISWDISNSSKGTATSNSSSERIASVAPEPASGKLRSLLSANKAGVPRNQRLQRLRARSTQCEPRRPDPAAMAGSRLGGPAQYTVGYASPALETQHHCPARCL